MERASFTTNCSLKGGRLIPCWGPYAKKALNNQETAAFPKAPYRDVYVYMYIHTHIDMYTYTYIYMCIYNRYALKNLPYHNLGDAWSLRDFCQAQAPEDSQITAASAACRRCLSITCGPQEDRIDTRILLYLWSSEAREGGGFQKSWAVGFSCFFCGLWDS